MNRQSSGWIGGILIVCLAVTGCREPAPQSSELGRDMMREMKLATPTVSGPSREVVVPREPPEIAKAAGSAMERLGVRLVWEGSTAQGQWLLGRSLADRNVLIQILPIYPGRSTIKITVEGGDALARELLDRLHSDIVDRIR